MRRLGLLLCLLCWVADSRAQFSERLQTLDGTIQTPADVDGDGILDFLTLTIGGPDTTRACCFSFPDTLTWYRHLGSFATELPRPLIPIETGGRSSPLILPADIDGDGSEELLLNLRLPQLHGRDSAGDFRLIAEYPSCIEGVGAFEDLNGDSRPDLVCNGSGGASLSIGFADESFDIASLTPFGPSGSSTLLASADLSGDGFPDLLIKGSASLVLGMGTSEGPVGTSEILTLPNTLILVVPRDLDADGDLDLFGVTSDRKLLKALNSGDGLSWAYSEVFSLSTAQDRYPLEIADMDNDGNLDAVHVSTVAYGLPDGSFEDRRVRIPVGPVARDLDSDGDLDLVGSFVARNSTVGALNSRPSAVRDDVEILEDAVSVIDVLSNDSDPDGDHLVVSMNWGPRVFGTTDQSTVGSAFALPDGTIRVTPPPDFSGRLWLNYWIHDPWGGFDRENVFIDVLPTNDHPLAINDTTYAKAGFPATVDVVANDSDPEDDVLTLSIDSNPTHGIAELVDGVTLRYSTSDAGFSGDSFTYKVTDPSGASASATVVVLTAPDFPPEAQDDLVTVDEDGEVTFDPLENDQDRDSPTITLVSSSDPANGSVSIANGQITYLPSPDFSGTDSFEYTVSDGNSFAQATVTITVAAINDAPTMSDRRFRTRPGVSLRMDHLAQDVDGDLVRTSVSTSPASGSLTHDQYSSFVTYEPASGFTGSDSFSLVARDPSGAEVEARFEVTVVEVFQVVHLDELDGSSSAAFADVNSDGVQDVVGAGGWIDYSSGTAIHTARPEIDDKVWRGLDFNRDGREDLCFYGNNSVKGSHSVRLNRGQSLGQSIKAYGCHPVADITDDGRSEVVFTVETSTNSTGELGVALSSLGELITLANGDYRHAVGVDLNDDGRDDILASTATGTEVWLAGPSGFELSASLPGTVRARAARLDGDVLMDVVGMALDNLSLRAWTNQGAGQFLEGPAGDTGANGSTSYSTITAFTVADLDGDGLDDVLTDESIWIQRHTDGWESPFEVTSILGHEVVDIGDVDGDSVPDALLVEPAFRNGDANRVYLYKNLIGIPPSGDPSVETVSASLTVAAGSLTQTLEFGLRDRASAGFDAAWDVPAPPAPPSPVLDARFKGTGLDLYTDIRDRRAEEHTWHLSVSSTVGTPVVSWDPLTIPDGLALQLIDAAGGDLLSVDMTQENAAQLLDGISDYHITRSVVTREQVLGNGWNLVGLPFEQLQDPVDVLFPRAIANTLFRFRQAYESPVDGRFEPGRGYWLRYSASQVEAIAGRPLKEVAIDLDAGWNLISPPNCTLPVASLEDPGGVVIQGTVFGYSGVYQPATSLSPGLGYWIRASDGGTITLRCSAGKGSAHVDPLAELLRVTVDGNHLFLGLEELSGVAYSIPPGDPEGAWQPSFEDGRYVAGASGLVSLFGAPRQVTIKADGATATLLDGNESALSSHSLSGVHQTVLDTATAAWLKLEPSEGMLPNLFDLSEPYPNPAQQSVRVDLHLPEEAPIALSFYDVTGRLVKYQEQRVFPAGVHSLELGLDRLTSGLYFLRASRPQGSIVRSLLLVK